MIIQVIIGHPGILHLYVFIPCKTQTRDINVAFKAAKRQDKIKFELERRLAKKGFVLRRRSPGGRHRTLLTSSTRARKLGRTANKVIDTSRNLVQR